MATKLSHYWYFFIPKVFTCLQDGYSASILRKDVFTGLTVAIISFPLAIALAIASGVPPERGLYTAIIAGFIISIFGRSRYQIGGPTGAFVVTIYSISKNMAMMASPSPLSWRTLASSLWDLLNLDP